VHQQVGSLYFYLEIFYTCARLCFYFLVSKIIPMHFLLKAFKPAVLSTAIALAGCASTHMQRYVGQDIREVILDSGPPVGQMDMGNGVRAFQFMWGGGTFAVPQTTRTVGTVTAYGNTAQLNAATVTSGGGVVSSEGCMLTYMTKWDEAQKTWIVSSYRMPRQLVC
jgi:hypothetical protein